MVQAGFLGWSQDTWNILVPLATAIVSGVALWTSLRSKNEQTDREKRAELRQLLQTIAELRNEFNTKSAAIASEAERVAFNQFLNTKRMIYLESAEYIAKQLRYVTAAEYNVLGLERMSDSDFRGAVKLFDKAVASSKISTTVTQNVALRFRAGASMRMGPGGEQNGERDFADAIKLVEPFTDPYSLYTQVCTYREWASAEQAIERYAFSLDRLEDAKRVCARMPDAFNYKHMEARQCSRMLLTLADDFLRIGSLDQGRKAVETVLDWLRPYEDDDSKQMRGYAHQLLGLMEAQNKAGAAVAFASAEAEYKSISLAPHRDALLHGLYLVAQRAGITANNARSSL